MALRVPVFEMHHVTATERARPICVRRLLARRLPESLLPLFLARKLVSVGVSVSRLVPHQLHKPLFCSALDLEHHCALQRAQPVVDEEKRHEDRRDADRHEPFIADMTWRMEHESVRRKLVVELPDERFECRAFEPQTELRDAAFEKFLIAERWPIGNFHGEILESAGVNCQYGISRGGYAEVITNFVIATSSRSPRLPAIFIHAS